MNILELKEHIINNAKDCTQEFKRLFHGRGDLYTHYEYLLVDSIDDVLYLTFFKESKEEKEIIAIAEFLYKNNNYACVLVQKRYLEKAPSEVIFGSLKEEHYIYEHGLKYKTSFLKNQNMGFFSDMKIGHEYVLLNAKDKTVLNLFSYTCAFSLCASKGGAKKVVNIDMSKSALNIGRENHRLNKLDLKKIKFMPHNILKSWNAIKKEGPYDLIIIDPPSFQKGSFAASKDYEKIVKRLVSFAASECVVLSCLNAPELSSAFIKDLFEKEAASFVFKERLENMHTHASKNMERALKNLIFVQSSRT